MSSKCACLCALFPATNHNTRCFFLAAFCWPSCNYVSPGRRGRGRHNERYGPLRRAAPGSRAAGQPAPAPAGRSVACMHACIPARARAFSLLLLLFSCISVCWQTLWLCSIGSGFFVFLRCFVLLILCSISGRNTPQMVQLPVRDALWNENVSCTLPLTVNSVHALTLQCWQQSVISAPDVSGTPVSMGSLFGVSTPLQPLLPLPALHTKHHPPLLAWSWSEQAEQTEPKTNQNEPKQTKQSNGTERVHTLNVLTGTHRGWSLTHLPRGFGWFPPNPVALLPFFKTLHS